MYETIANARGGRGPSPPSPWVGKTEFRHPAPDQKNIALPAAREHGKSLDDAPDGGRRAARDRVLRRLRNPGVFFFFMEGCISNITFYLPLIYFFHSVEFTDMRSDFTNLDYLLKFEHTFSFLFFHCLHFLLALPK